MRLLQPTNPAAGAAVSVTAGRVKKWLRIRCVQCSFTNAGLAIKSLLLTFGPSGANPFTVPIGLANVGATSTFCTFIGGPQSQKEGVETTLNQSSGAIPDLMFSEDVAIGITVNGAFTATDQFSAVSIVLEDIP